MELKKTPKASLENKKFLFLEIGISISLLFMLVAFGWTTKEKPDSVLTAQHQTIVEEEEQIPITEQAPPPPPQEIPQVIQFLDEIDIVEDDVEIKSDFDFSESETNNNLLNNLSYVEKKAVVVATKEEEVDEIIPFAIVEKKPKFMGKDASAFRDWINDQIAKQGYPAAALENNIQGTVLLSFTVNTDGTLSDIRIIKKVDPILSDAVLEIVKKSPKWTPGSQQNKPVKVPYQVPVVFKLQN